MPSGSIPVTPALGVAIALLLIAAAAVAGLGRLARYRDVLFAGVRGAVQLAAVSLLIAYLVQSTALAALFIVLMFAIAAHTAGRRITGDRSWLWAGLPIAAGVAPAVGLLVVTGAVPLTGLVLIPLVGQLIGGAMVATALAGRRLLDELHHRRGEVEAALALGMTGRCARLEIARPAAGSALVPALDQTRTVGTVTLPGAFVGMLLGGATPVQAGVVQLYVLVALLAVESVAILVALEIVARGLLTSSGRRLFFRA
ncbi:ABC transporter permease [Saccharopolyspora hirsuta]|uniref:ABC transporter permease n=1 Tax=Saccharopolyspora hirsuta TaxID=1837 RepID=A0A5M7BY07_SACHI|nr:ABC transporter permease [Saccharopolyspora hirsuta]KAA5834612.1 ABC transporter permease [Saccharopolyspora hirsuta]